MILIAGKWKLSGDGEFSVRRLDGRDLYLPWQDQPGNLILVSSKKSNAVILCTFTNDTLLLISGIFKMVSLYAIFFGVI